VQLKCLATIASLATFCLFATGCPSGEGAADGGFIHHPADADPHAPDADPDPPDAAPHVDAAPIIDGGACSPVVTQCIPAAAPHVTEGSTVVYETDPPNSGPHYPVWARWDESYGPGVLARPYWVHNLEHGGVVFLWNCPQAGGCPEVVADLEALQAALPQDPICATQQPPLRTRSLISSDTLLPPGVQVAAAAWGWTYTATCFDAASLRSFYDDHFGHGSESLCGNGSRP
jgi:hypothetical protein